MSITLSHLISYVLQDALEQARPLRVVGEDARLALDRLRVEPTLPEGIEPLIANRAGRL